MPILCGAAAKGIGIAPLLDAIVDLLPSPADLPPWQGDNPKTGEQIERAADPAAPFSALVFKTVVDPFAGRLSILRIVSGRATGDMTVANAARDGRERLGHLFKLEGKKQTQVPAAIAASIIAVAKLKDTHSGDTLADEKHPILYPPLPDAPAADLLRAGGEEQGRRREGHAGPPSADGGGHGAPRPPRRADEGVRHLGHRAAARRGRRRAAQAQVRRRGRAESAEGAVQGDDQGRRQGAGEAQEADRRPRPVRRHLHRALAAAARRRLRIRGRDRRRLRAAPVHPRRRQGRARAAAAGHPRRLPDRRRQGEALRRGVPRRRLVGDGVQDRRAPRLPQGVRAVQAGAARARS